jgi:O-antigen/teichoic acid export membrane protein
MQQAAEISCNEGIRRSGRFLPSVLGHAHSASAILFLARMVGAGMGFLVQMLLAKTYAQAELGQFFFALSIATLAAMMASLGYPSLAGRIASRKSATGGRLAGFVKFALAESLLISLGVSAILFAGFAFAGYGLAALFLIASIPFLALGPMATAALNLSSRNLAAFLPDLLFRPASLLAFLGIGLLAGIGWNLAAVSGFYFALAAAITLFQFSAIAEALRPISRARDSRLLSVWRRLAMPLAFVTVFTSFYPDMAIVSAGLFLSSADLAVFAIAMKISYLVGFASQISQQVATPELAGALIRGDVASIRAVYLRASIFPGLVTILAVVGFYFFGDEVLALFGPDYVRGHGALLLLLSAQMIRAFVGPIVQFAIVAGAVRPLVLVLVPATAGLLLSLGFVTSDYGIGGAAACVSAYLLWPLLLAFVLRKRV